MSATPLQVLTRPFAIEPVTNIMLPDGIFDNAIYNLRIACHYTNTSTTPLNNVTLYLESLGDPGIVPVAKTFSFDKIPAGASVLVMWDANFKLATPGKPLVSFVAQADGFDSKRSILQIFVAQTRYNSATNTYTCSVPEGTLKVSKISAIVPAATWGCTQGKDRRCVCPPKGPWVPTGVTIDWAPNPAFAGLHGELPFSDPWWKILALLVALIAAIVAAVEAATGGGTAGAGVSGTVDETEPSVHCCSPASGGDDVHDGVAGAASAVAVAALATACSDAADPFWRGQENTTPAAGETTIGEQVVAKWSLPEAPNAGKAYPADVEWTYTRFTTGKTYTYSVKETQINVHVSDGVELDTPAIVNAFDPLWVKAKFQKTGGDYFKGAELYAYAIFQAPNNGLFFVVPLTDDGLGFDPGANDTIYAGALDLREAYKLLLRYKQDVRGLWRIFVYAQDVNLTKPGTPPEIAAQHIGGFFVASALTITFDPSLPCPLKAQAAITVV
ncbi:MAG TPA: hypothetical protein VGI81_26380 [Tepidisphaeraceae bacterium]|jgi:hypothetical protein